MSRRLQCEAACCNKKHSAARHSTELQCKALSAEALSQVSCMLPSKMTQCNIGAPTSTSHQKCYFNDIELNRKDHSVACAVLHGLHETATCKRDPVLHASHNICTFAAHCCPLDSSNSNITRPFGSVCAEIQQRSSWLQWHSVS